MTQAQPATIPHDLLKAATAARLNSYSPYSERKVGAAVRMKSGKIYSGCNVENSSYGGSICAERNAIHHAIASGEKEITEVLVVTDETPPWPPCGFCRQVMSEFSGESTRIHATDLSGNGKTFLFKEILPEAFRPKHMGK